MNFGSQAILEHLNPPNIVHQPHDCMRIPGKRELSHSLRAMARPEITGKWDLSEEKMEICFKYLLWLPQSGGWGLHCTAKHQRCCRWRVGSHDSVLDFFGLLGTAFEIPSQSAESRYGTSYNCIIPVLVGRHFLGRGTGCRRRAWCGIGNWTPRRFSRFWALNRGVDNGWRRTKVKRNVRALNGNSIQSQKDKHAWTMKFVLLSNW